MSATVDDRFLSRWTESQRRESEARRFLARQPYPGGTPFDDAIDEIVSVFSDHGTPGKSGGRGPLDRSHTSLGDLLD